MLRCETFVIVRLDCIETLDKATLVLSGFHLGTIKLFPICIQTEIRGNLMATYN